MLLTLPRQKKTKRKRLYRVTHQGWVPVVVHIFVAQQVLWGVEMHHSGHTRHKVHGILLFLHRYRYIQLMWVGCDGHVQVECVKGMKK